jgi:hypothetical protein
VFLTVLGKLSIKCGDNQKATTYLTKSLSIEPTVSAYQIFGDLLSTQGDKDRASECLSRVWNWHLVSLSAGLIQYPVRRWVDRTARLVKHEVKLIRSRLIKIKISGINVLQTKNL